MRRNAFTLIELLVVIAIIAILAAILFPVFAQARAAARKSTCLSNVKQLNLGMQQYISDYDERFPSWGWANRYTADSGGFWDNAIMPYVKNTQVYRCPDDILEWTHDEDLTRNGPDKGKNDQFVSFPGKAFWDKPNNPNYASYGINEGLTGGRKLAAVRSPAQYTMLGEGTAGFYNAWEDSSGGRDLLVAGRAAFSAQAAGCCMMWEERTAQDFKNVYGAQTEIASRHNGGTNLTYVDGHAKFTKWQLLTFGNLSPRN
jgi:prepilin-type N-terminal cleavage/methylation domain-containing protein/prepilin-type processing-associated H-X9-DG protein